MSKITRRGYVPTDEKEFKNQNLYKLYKASDDLLYLLNRYNNNIRSCFI